LVETEITNLPTSKNALPTPQSQSEKAIYQPYQPTTETFKTSGRWQEKNGHKLSTGMWVFTSNEQTVRLLAVSPLGNGWLAAPDKGPEIHLKDQEITHVWGC
jgi:hypothetical protein